MVRAMPAYPAFCLMLTVILPTTVEAANFSIITTLGGDPQVGAMSGDTIYGTQRYGGTGNGSLFTLTTAGTYALLHNFVPGTDGDNPNARLVFGTGGTVWGTTEYGGQYSGGTLFTYGPSGFSMAHAFGNGTDGNSPLQGPVTVGPNTFVVTNSGGAVKTNGNLVKFQAHVRYSVLHNFLSGTDGHCPFSGATRSPLGPLFGTTVGRGFGGNPNGSIWRYYGGSLKTVYLFKDGADGEWPDQAPVADSQGNVYGTTHIKGGSEFAGAIWKLTPQGVFTVLHSFVAGTDGSDPNAPLILNTDGYLYGTTASGGSHNDGTVFRISTTGQFQLEYSFTGGADGSGPSGSLVHDSKGAIYGATGSGTVFKITN
jgi:uncharacterized repeat protein (TIGR03803 family)